MVGKQRHDVVEREPVEAHVLLRVPAVLRRVADVSDHGGVTLGDRLGTGRGRVRARAGVRVRGRVRVRVRIRGRKG